MKKENEKIEVQQSQQGFAHGVGLDGHVSQVEFGKNEEFEQSNEKKSRHSLSSHVNGQNCEGKVCVQVQENCLDGACASANSVTQNNFNLNHNNVVNNQMHVYNTPAQLSAGQNHQFSQYQESAARKSYDMEASEKQILHGQKSFNRNAMRNQQGSNDMDSFYAGSQLGARTSMGSFANQPQMPSFNSPVETKSFDHGNNVNQAGNYQGGDVATEGAVKGVSSGDNAMERPNAQISRGSNFGSENTYMPPVPSGGNNMDEDTSLLHGSAGGSNPNIHTALGNDNYVPEGSTLGNGMMNNDIPSNGGYSGNIGGSTGYDGESGVQGVQSVQPPMGQDYDMDDGAGVNLAGHPGSPSSSYGRIPSHEPSMPGTFLSQNTRMPFGTGMYPQRTYPGTSYGGSPHTIMPNYKFCGTAGRCGRRMLKKWRKRSCKCRKCCQSLRQQKNVFVIKMYTYPPVEDSYEEDEGDELPYQYTTPRQIYLPSGSATGFPSSGSYGPTYPMQPRIPVNVVPVRDSVNYLQPEGAVGGVSKVRPSFTIPQTGFHAPEIIPNMNVPNYRPQFPMVPQRATGFSAPSTEQYYPAPQLPVAPYKPFPIPPSHDGTVPDSSPSIQPQMPMIPDRYPSAPDSYQDIDVPVAPRPVPNINVPVMPPSVPISESPSTNMPRPSKYIPNLPSQNIPKRPAIHIPHSTDTQTSLDQSITNGALENDGESNNLISTKKSVNGCVDGRCAVNPVRSRVFGSTNIGQNDASLHVWNSRQDSFGNSESHGNCRRRSKSGACLMDKEYSQLDESNEQYSKYSRYQKNSEYNKRIQNCAVRSMTGECLDYNSRREYSQFGVPSETCVGGRCHRGIGQGGEYSRFSSTEESRVNHQKEKHYQSFGNGQDVHYRDSLAEQSSRFKRSEFEKSQNFQNHGLDGHGFVQVNENEVLEQNHKRREELIQEGGHGGHGFVQMNKDEVSEQNHKRSKEVIQEGGHGDHGFVQMNKDEVSEQNRSRRKEVIQEGGPGGHGFTQMKEDEVSKQTQSLQKQVHLEGGLGGQGIIQVNENEKVSENKTKKHRIQVLHQGQDAPIYPGVSMSDSHLPEINPLDGVRRPSEGFLPHQREFLPPQPGFPAPQRGPELDTSSPHAENQVF
jgi:hypothetical protein